tara:strand:+ start:722 stop:907 length:186 start_codon:yes stop_codon:yes gene_type:complete
MERDEKIKKRVTIIADKKDKRKIALFMAVLVDVAKDMGLLATIKDLYGQKNKQRYNKKAKK